MIPMEPKQYEKGKGGLRNEGAEYQYNLTLTSWLRADKTYGATYQILPEWDLAGNLDDVVLKYRDEERVHYRFLQAKHFLKESQTIFFEHLFNKKEFMIEKYFESYEDFHKKIEDGEIEDLILFTNLALNADVLPYVEKLSTDDDPIFRFPRKEGTKKTPIMHKLNQKFIDEYTAEESVWRRKFENNKTPRIWNPEGKALFKKFCDLFKLATNQPNAEELVKFIKIECEEKRRQSDSAIPRLKNDIRDWYNNDKSPYPLNSISLKTIMSRIEPDEMGREFIKKTKRNIDRLSPLQLKFKNIPYEEDLKSFFQPSEKVKNFFYLNTKGYMNVSLLKLFKCLEKLQQIDYLFCPKAEISKIEKFLKEIKDYEIFKILVCEIQSSEIGLEFMKKVEDLMHENNEKQVILVTNLKTVAKEMNSYHPVRDDLTYFEDLTEGTLKDISETEIKFQGEDVPFNTIYDKQIPPNHQDIESWGILLGEQIKMNKTIFNSDLSYYINRTLAANLPYFIEETIQQELGDQHIVTHNKDDFNEQIKQHPTKHVHMMLKLNDFWCVVGSNWKFKELSKYKEGTHQFKFNDNDGDLLHQIGSVFVISDMAGYGKTTTTSYLANELQKKHPNCWVTRLQPSQLSFVAENIETDFKMNDVFLMDKIFMLSSPLERLIFKQYLEDEETKSQLFFIFDGFDEIGIKYQKVIIQAVNYLKTKRNVKFIGILTRPQHQERLEEELQSVTFKLHPFDHQNKITFLEKFWLSRRVKGQKERLRDYSERLIRRISESISDEESELTGIPLQMRMIGEIYEDDAIKYLTGDLKGNEIVAVNMFGLYEQFSKKKEDVYVNDKLRSIPGAAANDIILKPFRKTQTTFALKVILGGEYGDLKDLEDSIGFGIIQENQGEYNFIHRTFAEFLTAKYFLDRTLPLPATFYIPHVMEIMYRGNCGVVRKFINSKLGYEKLATELKKPEYEEAIQNINHQQFQEAMRTSTRESLFQVFCFQLEFYSYWYPKEMEEFLIKEAEEAKYKLEEGEEEYDENFGLLDVLCRSNNISLCIHYMTQVWSTSDHKASELLLQMLKWLILKMCSGSFSLSRIYSELTVKIVTDFQDELEEKRILSEEGLKSILFEIKFNGELMISMSKWSFDYMKHLKMKHEKLYDSFFIEKHKLLYK